MSRKSKDSRSMITLVKKIQSFFTNKQGCRIQNDEELETSIKNGSILLEQLIASFNGIYNPIHIFSTKEIQIATNNFQSSFRDLCYHLRYKGTIDHDRPVLIKNYNRESYKEGFDEMDAYRDISTSIQMSNHNNSLKLIGCCLDFPVPVLVFEDAEIGPLDERGRIHSTKASLPWKVRLKMVKDIAYALTYLHTAFSRPIIHRDVNPTCILLDKDYTAKLTGFSLSVLIPEGQTHFKDSIWRGTMYYMDPEYFLTGRASEKSDVYGFGVVLLVLLTGRAIHDLLEQENNIEEREAFRNLDKPETFLRQIVDGKPLDEIVDPKIWEGGEGFRETHELQFKGFLELALRCTYYRSVDRPLMIDVTKELDRIDKLTLGS